MFLSRTVFFSSLCLVLLLSMTSAWAAEDGTPEGVEALVVEEESQGFEFLHRSALQIRATPLGLSLFSDTGFALSLWDNPESALLSNTKLEFGAATSLSPAFGWAGPYVEFVPLAVLRLRVAAQFMGYLGNFGYLYVPDDGNDWSLDALDQSADQGLGEASTGYLIQGLIQPQIRVGRIVVMAETHFYWISMDVPGNYYEPYFDMLFAPDEFYFFTRPTLGYLIGSDLSEGYVLLGARWERAATSNTELVRDTVGVVVNWKIHKSLMTWGDPSLAGFGGVFIDHPNRGEISPYLGVQFLTSF